MYRNKTIFLVIPCYNEKEGIACILKKKPEFIDEVIVADNNSTDNSREVAKKFGARVILEKIKEPCSKLQGIRSLFILTGTI